MSGNGLPETCSHCGFPIHRGVALRHYGTHTAHQEDQCLRLLHAEIDSLRAEIVELREELASAQETNRRLAPRALLPTARQAVEAAERERCAIICDAIAAEDMDGHFDPITAAECASLIRG